MSKHKISHIKVMVGGVILAVVGAIVASLGTHAADAIGGVMILIGVITAGTIAFLWYGYF